MTDFAVTSTEAVARIKAMQPDASKFCIRRRGYVDWKFGEVAAYLGYQGAVAYVESVQRWVDFDRYHDSLLINTYNAFLEAEKQTET